MVVSFWRARARLIWLNANSPCSASRTISVPRLICTRLNTAGRWLRVCHKSAMFQRPWLLRINSACTSLSTSFSMVGSLIRLLHPMPILTSCARRAEALPSASLNTTLCRMMVGRGNRLRSICASNCTVRFVPARASRARCCKASCSDTRYNAAEPPKYTPATIRHATKAMRLMRQCVGERWNLGKEDMGCAGWKRERLAF